MFPTPTSSLTLGDTNSLPCSNNLPFQLSHIDFERIRVVSPNGSERQAPNPETDPAFGESLAAFRQLTQWPAITDHDRADLTRHATTVGARLFATLIGDPTREPRLRLTVPNASVPLLTIGADSDDLLKLPWELLHDGGRFLVRESVLDVARSVSDETRQLPTEPRGSFSRVSASADDLIALISAADQPRSTPTASDAPDDLLTTWQRGEPAMIYFSGHGHGTAVSGSPVDNVPGRKRPRLVFLNACQSGMPENLSTEFTVALLHRSGIPEVVGYCGPIADELCTRSVRALYAAITAGQPTESAVRQARSALGKSWWGSVGWHREPTRGEEEVLFPFAWSQLINYHHRAGVRVGIIDSGIDFDARPVWGSDPRNIIGIGSRGAEGESTNPDPAQSVNPRPDPRRGSQPLTTLGILEAIRTWAISPLICEAILDAESASFTDDQILEILPLLRAFISANRASTESGMTVVASAVRTYIALLPVGRLDEAAALFAEPGQPEGVESELAKMVTRKLTANPPDQDDLYPGVAKRLAELAEAYLHPDLLIMSHYGAVAMNSVLGIALMRTLHWKTVSAKVEQLSAGWFRQQLGRRAGKLAEELSRDFSTGQTEAQQSALRQLIEIGRREVV